MKTYHDFPACKLPPKLRGHLTRGTRVSVTIETADEISASLEESFKRMAADRARLEAEGKVKGQVA